MSDILETSREGRVMRLRLNRPEKRNALSSELCLALVREAEAAEKDDSIGAVLLTANGPAFCAGMDLSELGQTSSEAIDAAQERLFTLGARLSKALIAAVGGPALGGGTGLAANCHIVVASPEATFGLTEIRLGLWPFLIYRAVTAAMGERRAVELSLTGRIFGAQEALEFGLVHEVARDAEARALEIAAGVAGHSPAAIQSGLRFAREVRGLDSKTAGEVARDRRAEIFRGAEFQKHLRLFREKRR